MYQQGAEVIFQDTHVSGHACQEEIERAILSEGQTILGWRDVSIDKDMPMSKAVKEKEPVIKQVFIGIAGFVCN